MGKANWQKGGQNMTLDEIKEELKTATGYRKSDLWRAYKKRLRRGEQYGNKNNRKRNKRFYL